MTIQVSSEAFDYNKAIPKRHARQGENVSPPLEWEDPPAGVRQLALIVDDPDATGPEPWVHWVIYNIPPKVRELPECVMPEPQPAKPTTTAQGKNSWGWIGYGGPDPPAQDGPHRYRFRLYALDLEPSLPPGLTNEQLMELASEHVQDEGELVGMYETAQ